MRKLSREILLAYTFAWMSFLFRELKSLKRGIRGIYLFGSVARGEFDESSDVDVFIDVQKEIAEQVKTSCKRSLKKFYGSNEYEKFRLRGIRNEIKPKVGNLDEWEELKRSIEKEAIVLFSPGLLAGAEKHFLVLIQPIEDLTKRNKVMRYLFGRKEKTVKKEGEVKTCGGEILTPRSFLIPTHNFGKIAEFLSKERVKYRIIEVWL